MPKKQVSVVLSPLFVDSTFCSLRKWRERQQAMLTSHSPVGWQKAVHFLRPLWQRCYLEYHAPAPVHLTAWPVKNKEKNTSERTLFQNQLVKLWLVQIISNTCCMAHTIFSLSLLISKRPLQKWLVWCFILFLKFIYPCKCNSSSVFLLSLVKSVTHPKYFPASIQHLRCITTLPNSYQGTCNANPWLCTHCQNNAGMCTCWTIRKKKKKRENKTKRMWGRKITKGGAGGGGGERGKKQQPKHIHTAFCWF